MRLDHGLRLAKKTYRFDPGLRSKDREEWQPQHTHRREGEEVENQHK